MGDLEARASALVESPVGYHPCNIEVLTMTRNPGLGQCQTGSLTGAVASQRVTEAPKGSLSADRNRAKECKGRRELNWKTDMSSRYESRA